MRPPIVFLLVSPFYLTVEKFSTYGAALERRDKIGTAAWKIYRSDEV